MNTTPYSPTRQEAADAYTAALLDQLSLNVTLETVRVATRKHERVGVQVEQARANRDDAIRAALDAGVPAREVANAAALTVMRVRQINRHTR